MSTTTTSNKTKMPKKPTYKPMPKAPSMSASLATWKKYQQAVMKTAAENQKKKTEYERKVSAIKSVEKAKKNIKDSVAKTRKRVPFGVRKED